MPKISVVMASRNCPEYIEEALESVQKQTFKDFEVIICDESDDTETRKILTAFAKKDKRFKPFFLKNKGLSGSINYGLRKARGEFIARMDSDDICLPRRFEKQVAFLKKNKDISLVGSWAYLIDKDGKRIGKITSPPADDATFRKRMIITGPWVSPTLMFRKAMLKKTGYFDTSFNHAEDYEFVSRALMHVKVANIQEFLLKYRWDFSHNLSFVGGKKTEWNALKVRCRMINRRQVPFWNVIYLVKPAISFLVPTRVKKFILIKGNMAPQHG